MARRGVWASSVDFGDETSLELDCFLGYHGQLTEKLSYSATAIYLTFEGQEGKSLDFLEGSFSVHYDDLELNYTVTTDTINTSLKSEHIALSYSRPISTNVKLELHAEHNFGEFYGEYDIDDYQNYEVSLSTKWLGLDIKSRYLLNNTKKADKISTGIFRNDNT